MKTLTGVLALCFGCAIVHAGPRSDQRQENQAARIQGGVASGELSEHEAARLKSGQQRIINMENRAASDGEVTDKEKARIERAQDTQSRHIYRTKHNQLQANP